MLVKEIGSGAASKVYRAICRKSGLDVAIKVYKKAALSALNTRQVKQSAASSNTQLIIFHTF
jgi:aurora kinase, other